MSNSEVPVVLTSAVDAACGACVQNTYLGEALWLFFVLLVLLMLGRAAFVFPISFMHNLWSREKLALREMIVIWSALTVFCECFAWAFGCGCCAVTCHKQLFVVLDVDAMTESAFAPL